MRSIRLPAALVTTLAGAALAAGAVAPAATAAGRDYVSRDAAGVAAKSDVRFLSLGSIPDIKGIDDWRETKVISPLLSREGCVAGTLPKRGSARKGFYSESESSTGMSQYAVRMPDHRAAKALVERLERCYSKSSGASGESGGAPGTAFRVFGDYRVADGLRVGANTTPRKKDDDRVQLYSVGRDGRSVTVLDLLLFTDGNPPKDTWVRLSKKALNRVR